MIWHIETEAPDFPQKGGPALAKLTYETLYERSLDNEMEDEVVIRDEYLGWVTESRPLAYADISILKTHADAKEVRSTTTA